jgi:biopolymer transport protein TolQ
VAPGLAEALIATAMGLFVAIPATMRYNMFLGMLEQVEVLLANFASVFLNRVHSAVDVRARRKG